MKAQHSHLECGPILMAICYYSAHEGTRDKMRNLHSTCGSRLSEPKMCRTCNKELEKGSPEIRKAYEVNSRTLVPIEAGELASLPVKSENTIEIVQFFQGPVDARLHGEHLYYLGPDTRAKSYLLLMRVMDKLGVKALARFKRSLYVIETYDGVLMMREVCYAADLREPGEIKAGIKATATSDKEFQVVSQLIGTMVQPLALESYTNAYTTALETLVEAKLSGKQTVTAPIAEAKPTEDDGLTDAVMAFLNKLSKPEGGVMFGQQLPVIETVTVPAGATVEMPQTENEAVLPW